MQKESDVWATLIWYDRPNRNQIYDQLKEKKRTKELKNAKIIFHRLFFHGFKKRKKKTRWSQVEINWINVHGVSE